MTDYRARYEQWLSSPMVDEASKAELRAIAGDEKEIEDRFYRDLEFGTAGLRGVMAAGTNRMNIYTVRRATQGVVNYLARKDPQARERGIAIAYDSRHHSKEFADETAAVANAAGFKTYVFESLRPTPELSFAIRELGCLSGMVLTASHNPSVYNGYKVYWEDGCQVSAPMDTEMIDEVEAVDLFTGVKVMDKSEAIARGLYITIGREIDEKFLQNVLNMLTSPEDCRQYGKDLSVVYTPLHGTGLIPVTTALSRAGFTNVHVVPSQAQPDGDFPTAPYPNPEDPKVFEPAIELGRQVDADILIATDPDADREGIMVKGPEGYVHFTGNMTGCLLLYHILEARRRNGTIPADGFIVKTIVSSEMPRAIAADYGVSLHECLTGFKFIGQQILRAEQSGHGTYLFGFEESYGCLCGTYVRDKNSVDAVLLLCEIAAQCKAQGKTLLDQMEELYKKYGYYQEQGVSLVFPGIEGASKITSLMDEYRSHPKESYAGRKVLEIRDYSHGRDGMTPSNVLRYILEDNCWFCIRPSGTEPKIKYYFGVKGSSAQEAARLVQALQDEVVPES